MSEYEGLDLNRDELEEAEDLYIELRQCFPASCSNRVAFAALIMCFDELEESEKEYFDKQSTQGLNGIEYLN